MPYFCKFLTLVLDDRHGHVLHQNGVEFHQEFNGHGLRYMTHVLLSFNFSPSPWTLNHQISNQTAVPCSDKITAVQIQSLSFQTQIIPQSQSSKSQWHDHSDLTRLTFSRVKPQFDFMIMCLWCYNILNKARTLDISFRLKRVLVSDLYATTNYLKLQCSGSFTFDFRHLTYSLLVSDLYATTNNLKFQALVADIQRSVGCSSCGYFSWG